MQSEGGSGRILNSFEIFMVDLVISDFFLKKAPVSVPNIFLTFYVFKVYFLSCHKE